MISHSLFKNTSLKHPFFRPSKLAKSPFRPWPTPWKMADFGQIDRFWPLFPGPSEPSCLRQLSISYLNSVKSFKNVPHGLSSFGQISLIFPGPFLAIHPSQKLSISYLNFERSVKISWKWPKSLGPDKAFFGHFRGPGPAKKGHFRPNPSKSLQIPPVQ